MKQTVGIGLLMLIGYVAVAPVAIPLLFGQIYDQPLHLIALVALLQIIRFTRIWPTTVALANGRTHQVLVNSLVRLIAFPTGYVGYLLIGGLQGLLIGIATGESAALLIGIVGVNRADARSSVSDLRLLGLAIAIGICITTGGFAWESANYLLVVAIFSLAAGLLLYLFASERALLKDVVALLRSLIMQPNN